MSTPGAVEAGVKIEAIEACLRGTAADRVDLWHLRELALSPGGLVQASLRRRAWPLLTRAVTQAPNAATTVLSPLDLWRIQRDAQQSRWRNVGERSKESPIPRRTPRRVQFATDFPTEPKEENKEQDPIQSSSSVPSIRAAPPPHTRRCRTAASAAEQRMVANVMTCCLQRDRDYTYYTGFHDLTTLLLMNLESLSLTSLLLGQLAVYHLRDALNDNTEALDTALRRMALPLLRRVDVDFMTTRCEDDLVSRLRPVIANWFASVAAEAHVASRLLDVFLVSHAAMPIYCAVASLVQNQPRLLLPGGSGESIDPLFSIESMETVEQIIARALQYMERFPPSQVLEWSQDTASTKTIAMFRETLPAWCTADSSPNEWTMHQRKRSEANDTAPALNTMERYPLSRIALGLPSIRRRRNRARILVPPMLFFFLAVTFLYSRAARWILSPPFGLDCQTQYPVIQRPLSEISTPSLSHALSFENQSQSLLLDAENAADAATVASTRGDTTSVSTNPRVNHAPSAADPVATEALSGVPNRTTIALLVVAPSAKEEQRMFTTPTPQLVRAMGPRLRRWVVWGADAAVAALHQSSPYSWYNRHCS